MPTNKDLKRLVRTRMEKTGESYTTARAQLISKKDPTEPVRDHAALAGGVSDEAIQAKTGRIWEKWVGWLDHRKADSLPHKEIPRLLDDNFDFGGWWAQMVTVGYERIKGLREIGQRRGGSYEANKSKTFPVPIDKLYSAWSDSRRRKKWIGDEELSVRKATPNKSIRFEWGDGTRVQVYFWEKGEAKSRVSIQHARLAAKRDIERIKTFWSQRLADLGELLR